MSVETAPTRHERYHCGCIYVDCPHGPLSPIPPLSPDPPGYGVGPLAYHLNHELVPVVSVGVLVATLCVTCDKGLEPGVWIWYCDQVWERYEKERKTAAYQAACPHEDTDQVVTWGATAPVSRVCSRCSKDLPV